jgi:hypothetical protein
VQPQTVVDAICFSAAVHIAGKTIPDLFCYQNIGSSRSRLYFMLKENNSFSK